MLQDFGAADFVSVVGDGGVFFSDIGGVVIVGLWGAAEDGEVDVDDGLFVVIGGRSGVGGGHDEVGDVVSEIVW